MRKYQVNANYLPPMGVSFENEHRQVEVDEEVEVRTRVNQADLQEEEIDCFEERPQVSGYYLPEKLSGSAFWENKRELFKASRNMLRNKLEREATLKRLAYHCVREVEKRYMRCVRNQNDYTNRAKKLHRECLVYWRKREKDLVEFKKKKDRLQTELKRKEEEEQEAKKMEKRLKFIMEQAGIYSHFMATKLGVQNEQKQEMDKAGEGEPARPGRPEVEIDREAAMLNVNQIINNKMDNLEKFETKKET